VDGVELSKFQRNTWMDRLLEGEVSFAVNERGHLATAIHNQRSEIRTIVKTNSFLLFKTAVSYRTSETVQVLNGVASIHDLLPSVSKRVTILKLY